MILVREYQLTNINWVLIPNLLPPIVKDIPVSELKDDDWKLAPGWRFGIATFSQYVEVHSERTFYNLLKNQANLPFK
jgi:hypothetical protein